MSPGCRERPFSAGESPCQRVAFHARSDSPGRVGVGSRFGSPFRTRRRWLGLVLGLVCAWSIAALDWQSGPGYRSASLTVAPWNGPGFTLMSVEATGLAFTNFVAESRHLTNQILLNGSGLAAGDVDGDGWCDLYLCSLDGPNALFRNRGQWRFEDVTAAAGVACPDLDATGAALADLDGDDDLDLIVNSVGGGTHVFLNDGKGRFTKSPALLNERKGGMTVALADVDGDGFLDVYVTNYRPSALMDMPNARATFKQVGGRTVIDRINGRPLTDPEFTNRFVVSARGGVDELGQEDVLLLNRGGSNLAPVPFTGGAFLDEDGQPLTAPLYEWGLAAMFRDANGDRLPDLYVCNDFAGPDRFWINQGDGRFRLLPRLAQRKGSVSAMAVDFADLNRDGWDDFVVLDMMSRDHRERMVFMPDRPAAAAPPGRLDDRPQYELNTMFVNRGDFTFAEIAQFGGVHASEWSWACAFLDVDLDGWEDLLVCNGVERAARDHDVVDSLTKLRASRPLSDAEIFQARRRFPRQATANLLFRNRGDLTFEEVGAAWGFDLKAVSSSLALADLDNDGDLDVVVNNFNGPVALYRNNCPAPRVAVRLRGLPPNTRGIGARVIVRGGPGGPQAQEIVCGGRYLASDDAIRAFAAGTPANRLEIEVLWRSGRRSLLRDVRPNRLYAIEEAGTSPSRAERTTDPGSQDEASTPDGSAAVTKVESPTILSDTAWPAPLFADVSHLLNHVHTEEPFDDFARQPLLPNKLSQLGPGITWFDLDGDGWDDLILPSGRGGQMAVFQNDGHGAFTRLAQPPLNHRISRDQTTVLGWHRAPGQLALLAGSANYEDGLATASPVRTYDLAGKTVADELPGQPASSGPLALADFDGDGDLDLFVGGRALPGRYPEPASSRVFVNLGGQLRADESHARLLEGVGLVSAALWSDLTGDGWPELLLACEWGPIKIFRNDRGRLQPWDPPLSRPAGATFQSLTGWWNGVATGDFDEDGQLDIVASNWGRNTKYEPFRRKPLQVFYGDFTGDGTITLVEAAFDPALQKNVPLRQLIPLARAWPAQRERFASHAEYAGVSVEELLGDHLAAAKRRDASWLESTVFLNRGEQFEARPLPAEAQWAPAFGLCVGDADGDGHEDLFLAQNFFAVQPETPRYDAGRGLWLLGDGRGGLVPMPGQRSGVTVYGEQRGAALCDYDADGRVDLAVTQNGAATKLFRNIGARPGLRVRLAGNPANPLAIGAALRLGFGDKLGPVRELQAGSGYWSQAGAVQVLTGPAPPSVLWVRWPGGASGLYTLPSGARAVEVHQSGEVKAIP